MWYLEKDVTISASHQLIGYDGPCARLHGHNWKITIYCKGDKLDKIGMLIDFKKIKEIVNKYDHVDITNIGSEEEGDINATAENLAWRLCESIPYCYKVMVEEQEGSRCTYVAD